MGYDVVCLPEITEDAGRAQGGVGLVVQDRPKGWSAKSTRYNEPNVVSCEVVEIGKWTPLIGVYLPTYTLEHLPDLEEALTHFRNQEPIVLGELNANIGQSQNPRSQQIADMLVKFGLVDLRHHFHQL